MIVYADILFCLNLIVNYFLLLLTARLGGTAPRLYRLALGALTGAAFSLTLLLPLNSEPLSLLIRLLSSVLIVFCVFGFRTLRRFIRLLALFYAATFAYAGVMLAVWFVFKPPGMVIQNSVVYFGISPLVLIATAAVTHLILALIRRFGQPAVNRQELYTISVTLYNTTCQLRALLDTGNALCDFFTDAPVIVADYRAIAQLLPPECRDSFAKGAPDCPPGALPGRFRLVPFQSVGGGGMLPGFRCDLVQTEVKGDTAVCFNAVVAVSPTRLSGDYDALISHNLINHSDLQKHEGVKAHAGIRHQ